MSNDKRVSTLVILLLGILIGIDLMMFGFSGGGFARNLGQILGSILFGYIFYGIAYLIFLRKKRSFSHNPALIIACVLLLSAIASNFVVTMQGL